MVKNVFPKAGIQNQKNMGTALVVIGWTAFLLGMFVNTTYSLLSVCFMAVARVLP